MPRIILPLMMASMLLLAACSGAGNRGSVDPRPGSPGFAAPGTGGLQADEIRSGSFSLKLLEDPQLGLPQGKFSFTAKEVDGGMLVEVQAEDAVDIRGMYLDLGYDESKWRPRVVEAGPAMEKPGRELLQLADLTEPGRVQLGMVLAGWDKATGFSGSGTVASFRFSAEAFPVQKESSQAADADSARARLEYFQAGNAQRLLWFYNNPGDYNQDGIVSISDLTPLGQNFGDSGPFEYSSAEAVVDGDGNDEINISDLTVIGQNLGNEVMQYAVYWSSRPDLDIPEDNTAIVEITPTAILDGTEEFNPFTRKRYAWDVDPDIELSPLNVMWVRPLDGEGNPGTPSNHTGEDNGDPGGQAAVAHLNISQLLGEAPLTITLDASQSYDPRGGAIDTYSYFINNDPIASYGAYAVTDESFSVEVAEPGSYMVSMSAVKDGLYSSTKPVLVSVTDNGNRAPVAIATLPNIFSFIETPATFLIDFAGSYDPDGDPLQFELDLWSHTQALPIPRGDFEVSNPAGTQYELNLTEPGSYGIDIKAIDDKGLFDIDTITLEVLADDGLIVPDAYLWPDSYEGTAPHLVDFGLNWYLGSDALSVDQLEFDPRGNGNWVVLDPLAEGYTFTYERAGLHKPRLRITDNRGYTGYSESTLELQIYSQPGIAPTAILTAADTDGVFQFSPNLDARQSFDQYGMIVKYEFDPGDGSGWREDLNNDGWFPYTYLTGEYDAMVRVTDDEGLTDTATLHISVL